MGYGLLKLAALAAKGPEYATTGEIKAVDRAELIRKAVEEIESIRKEQEKTFASEASQGFDSHHSQLEQKRIRYQKKKKNKDYGLKRHRQKRIVGKRHRRSDRLWEKGVILKKAQADFHERLSKA